MEQKPIYVGEKAFWEAYVLTENEILKLRIAHPIVAFPGFLVYSVAQFFGIYSLLIPLLIIAYYLFSAPAGMSLAERIAIPSMLGIALVGYYYLYYKVIQYVKPGMSDEKMRRIEEIIRSGGIVEKIEYASITSFELKPSGTLHDMELTVRCDTKEAKIRFGHHMKAPYDELNRFLSSKVGK